MGRNYSKTPKSASLDNIKKLEVDENIVTEPGQCLKTLKLVL